MHRRQHVKPDDLKCEEAKHQRRDAKPAKIYGTDLSVAQQSQPIFVSWSSDALTRNQGVADPEFRLCGADLYLGVDISYSDMEACRSLAPNRQVEPPVPPFRPTASPEWAADDDANRAPEHSGDREEQAEAVNAEGAD